MPVVDLEKLEDFSSFLDDEKDKEGIVVFIFASTPVNIQTGIQGFGLQVGFLVSDGIAVRHTHEVGSIQLVNQDSKQYEGMVKKQEELKKELNMLKDTWTKRFQGKGFLVVEGVVT